MLGAVKDDNEREPGPSCTRRPSKCLLQPLRRLGIENQFMKIDRRWATCLYYCLHTAGEPGRGSSAVTPDTPTPTLFWGVRLRLRAFWAMRGPTSRGRGRCCIALGCHRLMVIGRLVLCTSARNAPTLRRWVGAGAGHVHCGLRCRAAMPRPPDPGWINNRSRGCIIPTAGPALLHVQRCCRG